MMGENQATSDPGASRGRLRRILLRPSACASLLVFLSAGYIQNSRPGWNVNSQFALTCSIVERGSLNIDPYHDSGPLATNDKAVFEGHYYCDKSPVTAFAGVPAFALYRAIAGRGPGGVNYDRARYWTTWWTVGLSAAILCALIAALLERRGVSSRWAAVLAGSWIMATPLYGYAILFTGYLPACAFAAGAWVLIDPILTVSRKGRPENAGSAGPAALRLGLAGVLMGLAAWTMPTFALLAVTSTVVLALRVSRRPSRRGGKKSPRPRDLKAILGLWPWVCGGLSAVALYAAYSFSIFGELTSPYRYEFDANFRERMQRGLMGAGLPNLRVLWLITFHPFRGLFTLFPATILAVSGLLYQLGTRRTRAFAAAGLTFFLGLLLYNAGYFMWWGGLAYAPRHLIPALLPLALGLGAWVSVGGRWATVSRRWARVVLAAALAAGAVGNVSVVSLDPQPPAGLDEEALYDPASVEQWPSPFVELLRYVWQGKQTDANWGTALGLKGPPSLAPLAILWIVGLAWIVFTTRLRGSPADPHNPSST